MSTASLFLVSATLGGVGLVFVRRMWYRPLHVRAVQGRAIGEQGPEVEERGLRADLERLRVVIADDHSVYRRGLAKMLTRSGIDVVGEAASGEAAIDEVEEKVPDVVIMDLNMPGLTGVDATRILTERSPATRVLVLSVSAEQADVTDAILAGAGGYVLKDDPFEAVVSAIRTVAAGQSLISPRIASMLLTRIRDRDQAAPGVPPVPLSDRELEVLKLIADGRPNQEIAEALFIEPSTVRHHVSSILMKLQVDNRVQAAVLAVRNRMV